MQDGNSLIIVGAGASAEFGLPTSFQIYRTLLEEADTWGISNNRYDTSSDTFLNFPLKELVLHMRGQIGPEENRSIRQIYQRVQNGFATSIDLFTFDTNEENTIEICKLFTAREIARACYEYTRLVDNSFGDTFHQYSPRNSWRRPMIGNDISWIAQLLQIHTENSRTAEDLDPGRLSFITFNYDTTIEDAIRNFLSNSGRFGDSVEDILPSVHHVHGSFPSFTDSFDIRNLKDWSESIQFVQDFNIDSQECIFLREMVHSSDHIYCVGFDFAPENIEILDLAANSDKVRALNFDGNLNLQRRMSHIGIDRDFISSGTANNPLGVSAAAKQGFFSL